MNDRVTVTMNEGVADVRLVRTDKMKDRYTPATFQSLFIIFTTSPTCFFSWRE